MYVWNELSWRCLFTTKVIKITNYADAVQVGKLWPCSRLVQHKQSAGMLMYRIRRCPYTCCETFATSVIATASRHWLSVSETAIPRSCRATLLTFLLPSVLMWVLVLCKNVNFVILLLCRSWESMYFTMHLLNYFSYLSDILFSVSEILAEPLLSHSCCYFFFKVF